VDTTADISRLAGDIAEADKSADVDDDAKELGDLRTDALGATQSVPTAEAGPALEQAQRQNADAALEVEETARGLSKGITLGADEREPSEEAQSELADASKDVESLTIRVEAAGDHLADAVRELDRAVRELIDDPSLTSEGQDRLGTVRKRLIELDRHAMEAIESLEGRVRSEADLLSSRSDELTPEPPDVILDCTSTVSTASDVSVRNMSCEEADALILEAIPNLAPGFTTGAFTCTILGDYGPPSGPILGAEDVRCESGDQAFRFGFAD
jgi:hypothetical protein